MTRHFLIDTDTGSDDAVALVMAMGYPGVQVEAITIVAGNVPVDQGVQNALYTVELCGKTVPVHRGMPAPLTRPLQTAQFVHGEDGMGDTLKHFSPKRLGHGVRSIEDPDLLAYLRDHRIHLEVCPTCNIQTDIYDAYADHPIDRLYRAGLSVGVNTDTRTMTNIRLSQEYKKLHQVFGWNTEDYFQCNKNALEAAFLPDGVRDRLMGRLIDGY